MYERSEKTVNKEEKKNSEDIQRHSKSTRKMKKKELRCI